MSRVEIGCRQEMVATLRLEFGDFERIMLVIRTPSLYASHGDNITHGSSAETNIPESLRLYNVWNFELAGSIISACLPMRQDNFVDLLLKRLRQPSCINRYLAQVLTTLATFND
ncbi:hypothetical protein ES703_117417 [subsurface metagenome]